MQPNESQNEIESLEFRIQHCEKMLDNVMTNDQEFYEAKKLLQTMRSLRERLTELSIQKEKAAQ